MNQNKNVLLVFLLTTLALPMEGIASEIGDLQPIGTMGKGQRVLGGGKGALYQVAIAAKGDSLTYLEACMRAYLPGRKEPLPVAHFIESALSIDSPESTTYCPSLSASVLLQ